ncbi:Crp/Fnr family transcriptional regulator [Sphingomonas sp.]|uniref:Crp/Fnr family transcriptional regulator n=1 Tax=Sphingomonas sp. TaxID=28214 RepID=UPI003CC644BC
MELITQENWIAELPAVARDAMISRMSYRELAPGKDIVRAGDAPRKMVQVVSGYVRLSGIQTDGRRSLITIYGPGNSYGETALVSHRDFNHTTTTMTVVEVGELATNDFWEVYHRYPEIPEALCRKFARAISRQIVGRDLRAEHRLGERIVMLFENLAVRCGRREGDRVTILIPFSQTDIADHFDVTRQSVQREVTALKRAGLLEKRDGNWTFFQRPRSGSPHLNTER